MNNKLFKKVLLTIIAILVVAGCIFTLKSAFNAKDIGEITVSVVDIDGNELAKKEIPFKEGDGITKLLEDNFDNVVIEDGFLYSIDKLTTPEDWSTFICLYVDGEMSEVGLLEVQFKDGTSISFVDTAMSW